MQDIRPHLADDLVEPAPEIADDRQFAGRRQFGTHPAGWPGAQELPVADPLAQRCGCVSRGKDGMFAAGDEHRLPAESALLIDDAEGTINIAALQRQ